MFYTSRHLRQKDDFLHHIVYFGMYELGVCPKECIVLLLLLSINKFYFPRFLVIYFFCNRLGIFLVFRCRIFKLY